MATQIPFTVRIPEIDYDTLTEVAKMRGIKIADLAREIIIAKIGDYLDPEMIEQEHNERRDYQLAVAAQLRAKRSGS